MQNRVPRLIKGHSVGKADFNQDLSKGHCFEVGTERLPGSGTVGHKACGGVVPSFWHRSCSGRKVWASHRVAGHAVEQFHHLWVSTAGGNAVKIMEGSGG